MRVVWASTAWDEFEQWVRDDMEITKQIVGLIRYIRELPPTKEGTAKSLKRDLAGYDSLEIVQKIEHPDISHRLVYRIKEGARRELQILSCWGHYPKDNRTI
jgi:Txe/YoeB family toxin of Txe-Axe toxin-antitoxin module